MLVKMAQKHMCPRCHRTTLYFPLALSVAATISLTMTQTIWRTQRAQRAQRLATMVAGRIPQVRCLLLELRLGGASYRHTTLGQRCRRATSMTDTIQGVGLLSGDDIATSGDQSPSSAGSFSPSITMIGMGGIVDVKTQLRIVEETGLRLGGYKDAWIEESPTFVSSPRQNSACSSPRPTPFAVATVDGSGSVDDYR